MFGHGLKPCRKQQSSRALGAEAAAASVVQYAVFTNQ
jgi:hypothetical protein